MSLDLMQLQSLLTELWSRLAEDLEKWSYYSSQGQERLSFPKDLALAKTAQLHHQMEQVKDSLLQLEFQMEKVDWKSLQLESRKEWE
jgi:hypothetical protein